MIIFSQELQDLVTSRGKYEIRTDYEVRYDE